MDLIEIQLKVMNQFEPAYVCVCVYIYKTYCTEIHGSTCWVTKLFLQPVYNIITSGIHESKCKTHQCFSSEKQLQWKKNTATTR